MIVDAVNEAYEQVFIFKKHLEFYVVLVLAEYIHTFED